MWHMFAVNKKQYKEFFHRRYLAYTICRSFSSVLLLKDIWLTFDDVDWFVFSIVKYCYWKTFDWLSIMLIDLCSVLLQYCYWKTFNWLSIMLIALYSVLLLKCIWLTFDNVDCFVFSIVKYRYCYWKTFNWIWTM